MLHAPCMHARVVNNVARLSSHVWANTSQRLLRAIHAVDLHVKAVEHAPRVERCVEI